MYSNFLLGELTIDPDALATLGRVPLDLIARHAVNDHGRITVHETRSNRKAMTDCGQLMSRYPVDPTAPGKGHVIVVTVKGWSSTIVQLEETS